MGKFTPRQLRYLWAAGIFSSRKGRKATSLPQVREEKKVFSSSLTSTSPETLSPREWNKMSPEQRDEYHSKTVRDTKYDSPKPHHLSLERKRISRLKKSERVREEKILDDQEYEWVKRKTAEVLSEISRRLQSSDKKPSAIVQSVLFEAAGSRVKPTVSIEGDPQAKIPSDVLSKGKSVSQWFGSLSLRDDPLPKVVIEEIVPVSRSIAYVDDGTLGMARKASHDQYAHEAAHILEFRNPRIQKESNEYRKRNYTDEIRPLKDLIPGSLYEPDEIAYVPRAGKENLHHYVGKKYDDDESTEVFSMAIERLYLDPHKLYRDQPDLFETVIRSLYLL